MFNIRANVDRNVNLFDLPIKQSPFLFCILLKSDISEGPNLGWHVIENQKNLNK